MERHISVLTEEVRTGLNLASDNTVVDCTLGSGGHAQTILAELGAEGTFVGVDLDPIAVEAAQTLTGAARTHFVCDNFRNITAILENLQIDGVDAILADMGWRTEQFQSGGKGFSFNTDEPLVMTYGDPEAHTFTAHDIVNVWEETSIADIIYGYGEERFARRIARAIVEARADGEIKSSAQLAEIVAQALPAPFRHRRIHPATKTFQALRIAVNDELEALKQLLHDGFALLRPSGRMAIISFHSLEDRIVKQAFAAYAHDQRGQVVTKKPITAAEDELATNPRARSAKLRIIEKY